MMRKGDCGVLVLGTAGCSVAGIDRGSWQGVVMQLRLQLQVVADGPIGIGALIEIQSPHEIVDVGVVGRLALIKLKHIGNRDDVGFRKECKDILRQLRVLISGSSRRKHTEVAAIVGARNAFEDRIGIVNSRALIISKPEPSLPEGSASLTSKLLRGPWLTVAVVLRQYAGGIEQPIAIG